MNPVTFPQMWSGGSNPFDGDEIQRLGLRVRGNPPTIVCFGHGSQSRSTLRSSRGRLKFGEHPHAALEREILEEVSLKVRVGSPVFVWTYVRESFQLVGITFHGRREGGDVSLGAEHTSFRWLTEMKATRASPNKDEIAAIFEHHKLTKRA